MFIIKGPLTYCLCLLYFNPKHRMFLVGCTLDLLYILVLFVSLQAVTWQWNKYIYALHTYIIYYIFIYKCCVYIYSNTKVLLNEGVYLLEENLYFLSIIPTLRLNTWGLLGFMCVTYFTFTGSYKCVKMLIDFNLKISFKIC